MRLGKIKLIVFIGFVLAMVACADSDKESAESALRLARVELDSVERTVNMNDLNSTMNKLEKFNRLAGTDSLRWNISDVELNRVGDISRAIGDKKILGELYYIKARRKWLSGDFSGGRSDALQSAELSEEARDWYQAGESYGLLARYLGKLQDRVGAYGYATKSLEAFSCDGDSDCIAGAWLDLAEAGVETFRLQEAGKYLSLAEAYIGRHPESDLKERLLEANVKIRATMAEQQAGTDALDDFVRMFREADSLDELMERLVALIPEAELSEMLRQDSLLMSAYEIIASDDLMAMVGNVFDKIMMASRDEGISEILVKAGNLDSYYEKRQRKINAAAKNRVALWTAMGLSAVLVAAIMVVVLIQERRRSEMRLQELKRLSSEVDELKNQGETENIRGAEKEEGGEVDKEDRRVVEIKNAPISPFVKLAEDSLARALNGSKGSDAGLFVGLETMLKRMREGDIPAELEREVNKRRGNVLKNFRKDYPEIYEDWLSGKSGHYRVLVAGAAGLSTSAAAYVMSTNPTGVYNRRKVLRQILSQKPCPRTEKYLRMI